MGAHSTRFDRRGMSAIGLLALLACVFPVQGAPPEFRGREGWDRPTSPTRAIPDFGRPGPRRSNLPALNEFRDLLGQYRDYDSKIDQAEGNKENLLSKLRQLEEKSRIPASSPFRDPFLGGGEISNLRGEIHQAISGIESLRRAQSELVDKFVKNAEPWKMEFQREKDRIASQGADPDLPDRTNRGRWSLDGQMGELDRYISALNALIKYPARPNQAIQRAWPDRNPAMEGSRRHPDRRGMEDMPPGPRPPMAAAAMIRRLEREQELLVRKYIQNEASLRKLRESDQAMGQGSSQPAGWVDRMPPAHLPAPLLRHPSGPGEVVPVSAVSVAGSRH